MEQDHLETTFLIDWDRIISIHFDKRFMTVMKETLGNEDYTKEDKNSGEALRQS